ncbi:peptidase [Aerosakkonemataceae cyanobacterium BLCC-F50]|uniref:Peptidase n=1 Tax=Floridaenema flaviceps BLCC-F50 TaxID=3153642 RepID=A0ABV4XX39_9CYAN
MYRLFRKYHRWLGIVCVLPLLLTVSTGITFPIAKALHQRQIAGFLIHLHTLETFGLDGFFPIINGLGLLGLLITGIYMTSLVRKQRSF